MSTFTASEWTSNVKAVHAGVQSKSAVAAVTVTGTASSVFKLCRIPNGATIVDFLWYVKDAGTDQSYELGIRYPSSDTYTVSESALSAAVSTTLGVLTRGSAKLPYKVSISDDAVQSEIWIEAKAVVAISASADHRFTVFYTMDGS
jgi:hypothetical protein